MAKLERTDKPVDVLLDELGEGVLGLPEIQRGYVWNRSQARDLIDSIYRKYPTGLILLWKPKEMPELRSGETTDGGRTPDQLILDGQQRLTSLKKVLDGEIDVRFNVDEESFQIYSSGLSGNPLWVSVKRVLDEGAVSVWKELKKSLVNHDPPIDESTIDKYLTRLSDVEKIREYRYPVMIMHTDDYEEITESFIRVNSRGTRLREAELAMAHLAFHWPGALTKQFEEALDDYEEAYYDLEARFLMRCYVAVATGQSRFRSLGDLWKKRPNDLESIWRETKDAFDHTINLLRNNAGIESSDWLPSLNALVPLVFYLSRKQGVLTGKEEKELLFWFFEATVHGRFTGSPETKIDQDIKAITSGQSIKGMIENIKRDIASFDVTTQMIEGKYQRNPFLPLMFVISRQKGARDWFTGTALSSTNVGPKHQLEMHHIFPKAVLKQHGGIEGHEIDDLANIAFLSQKANRSILRTRPEEYLAQVEEERLKAQHVPLDRELWKIDRFRDFLIERRGIMARAIDGYMKDIGSSYLS